MFDTMQTVNGFIYYQLERIGNKALTANAFIVKMHIICTITTTNKKKFISNNYFYLYRVKLVKVCVRKTTWSLVLLLRGFSVILSEMGILSCIVTSRCPVTGVKFMTILLISHYYIIYVNIREKHLKSTNSFIYKYSENCISK